MNKVYNNIEKIIIHAGYHKTATTSIQETLFQNKDLLLRKGIYYPHLWWKNNGVVIYSLFSRYKYSYHVHVSKGHTPEDIDDFNSNMINSLLGDKRLLNCKVLVFSGEDIGLLKCDEIEKMKLFLGSHFPESEVEIHFGVREHINYAASLYQQMIQDSTITTNDYERIIEIAEGLYSSRITHFEKVFGQKQIRVHNFDEMLVFTDGPVGYFLNRIMQLTPSETRSLRIKHENTSVSNHAIELISYINEKYPLYIDGKLSSMRKLHDIRGLLSLDGSKYTLPDEVVNKLKQKSQDDLCWIEKNYHIKFNRISKRVNEKEYSIQYFSQLRELFQTCSDALKLAICCFVNEKYSDPSNKNYDSFSNLSSYFRKVLEEQGGMEKMNSVSAFDAMK